MKNFKILFTISVISITFLSCKKRLDDFLFNNDDTITEYHMDNFQGEESLIVPDSIFVPSSMIHQFKFTITSEGESLDIAAIYTGNINSIATDTVIMYCHGNRDHMDYYWSRQKVYSRIGHLGRYGVLMIDYPGYGLSEGKPTETNMYDAVDGALNWLKENGLTDDRLIMFGFSLGSAPTCKIAGGQGYSMNPSKIILEAPFASSEVMVQDASVLNMPASYFVNVKIENAENIKSVNAPLLWLHGIEDDFLSIETHGEVVFENHNNSWKRAVRVPGAGHEGVPDFMGIKNYQDTILDFILSVE